MYGVPPLGLAYARPILTKNYITTLGATADRAYVRIYDRESAADTAAPREVFLKDGRESSEFDIPPGERTRYDVALAIATSNGGLEISTPFGQLRLQAGDTR
jgi:hypothetical protein